MFSISIIRSNFTKCVSVISATTPKYSLIPAANITSKENLPPDYKAPKPWPYEKKNFYARHAYFYSTLQYVREENAKVVVVDGNIGAGKSNFCKTLAESLDFKLFPEPTVDQYYTTEHGYDLRKLDPIAPKSYKVCELKTYYENPHHHNVTQFQFRMNHMRLVDYITALAHVLSTGQGVILERSVFSDFVFVEAMFKAGYLRKEARQYYYDVQGNTQDELLRPHLIIYLDISVDTALERIKQRNNPIEVNSPVLTKDYLEDIEYFYKQKYLKQAEKSSELLIYDWNNYGDMEVVVEDVERIDFERLTKYDTKCKDWLINDDWEWAYFRRKYATYPMEILMHSYIWRPHIEEVYHPASEVEEWKEIIDRVPGEKYSFGYNPSVGDNVWFKTKMHLKRTFNRH